MSSGYSIHRPAQELADTGALAWRAVVHAQMAAEAHHSDFYALAGHLIDTLGSARSLVGVLARRVERYPAGRDLYDDTGTVDPRERLELALLELEEAGVALDESIYYLNRFHSAIGHIGYRETEDTESTEDGAR
ncbi:MAG: hypothetical protein M3235_15910 [Actinomycetota bacterium]|nr:hypothetical protein [Actinomycetota bacterium]